MKEPEILEIWRKEQDNLKQKLIKTDFYNFNLDNTNNINTSDNITELKYIAGMDISASKQNPNIAVSALVICDINLKSQLLHSKSDNALKAFPKKCSFVGCDRT